IEQVAVLVTLQIDALPARQFGNFVKSEDDELPVLADDSNAVSLDRLTGGNFSRRLHVHHALAGARHGNSIILTGDKPMTGRRRQQQFTTRLVREHGDEIGLWWQIDKRADRFSVATAAWKFRAIKGEEPAVRGQHHQFVGRLGMDPKALAIPFAIFDCLARLLMSPERAQPALFRADDGDRLAL